MKKHPIAPVCNGVQVDSMSNEALMNSLREDDGANLKLGVRGCTWEVLRFYQQL